jgi:hypothetical protein
MRYVVTALSALVTALSAQNSGPDALVQRAEQAMQHRSYEKAAVWLEQALVIEKPEQQARIHELLGIAYLGGCGTLNGEVCRNRAEESMNKAIGLNGRAAFLVDRAFDRKILLVRVPQPQDVVRGKLYLSKSEIVFEPDGQVAGKRGERLVMPADTIEECALDGKTDTNVFKIDTKKGNYFFRTANHDREEAEILFRLVAKYMNLDSTARKGKK